MAPHVSGPTRKSHTKSRRGCRTCKKRHIRCDETPHQCKNCTKHNVICDYADSPPPVEESSSHRQPNVLSTPQIEREIGVWRSTGVFPFPEMNLQYPQQFQGLIAIDLRLIHHLSSIYRDMRLADFMGCTLWVQQIPSFLDAAYGHGFAMSAILAFSATHMAYLTHSAETNNLAYHYRGIALKGLHEAIGNFSQENSDAVLAASILLAWQASDWGGWTSLMVGISTVIGSMVPWRHLSRFATFMDDHPSFFMAQSTSIPFDDQSILLATDALRQLSARLPNVHPLFQRVHNILGFAHDFRSCSRSMQSEQLFEKLQSLRSWLFWMPVSLVKANDMSSSAMVLLAQMYTLAHAIDACIPELGGAALGSLTGQAIGQIDLKLRPKVSLITPGEMQPSELENLMQFPRLMFAKHQLDSVNQENLRPRGERQHSPYSFHRLSVGSQPGTPNYPPPSSPGMVHGFPVLGNQSFEDLSIPPSPFLQYDPVSQRQSALIERSPMPSEHSFDNRSISGYSHQGDSPAYSPAAYSPVFLPEYQDDDSWDFAGGDSPSFSGGDYSYGGSPQHITHPPRTM